MYIHPPSSSTPFIDAHSKLQSLPHSSPRRNLKEPLDSNSLVRACVRSSASVQQHPKSRTMEGRQRWSAYAAGESHTIQRGATQWIHRHHRRRRWGGGDGALDCLIDWFIPRWISCIIFFFVLLLLQVLLLVGPNFMPRAAGSGTWRQSRPLHAFPSLMPRGLFLQSDHPSSSIQRNPACRDKPADSLACHMDGLDLAHPPGDSTWSVCSPQQPPGSPIVVAAVVVVKIPSSSPTPSSSMRRMRYRRMRRTGRERASGVAFFEVRRNHAFNDIRSYW